jgi:hypothetical protein
MHHAEAHRRTYGEYVFGGMDVGRPVHREHLGDLFLDAPPLGDSPFEDPLAEAPAEPPVIGALRGSYEARSRLVDDGGLFDSFDRFEPLDPPLAPTGELPVIALADDEHLQPRPLAAPATRRSRFDRLLGVFRRRRGGGR